MSISIQGKTLALMTFAGIATASLAFLFKSYCPDNFNQLMNLNLSSTIKVSHLAYGLGITYTLALITGVAMYLGQESRPRAAGNRYDSSQQREFGPGNDRAWQVHN